MKKFWKKIKLALREILNLLTNLLCPLISGVCIVMEVFQCPASAIQVVKQIEYWAWKVGGTKDAINGLIDKVDDAVDKTEDEHNDIIKNN